MMRIVFFCLLVINISSFGQEVCRALPLRKSVLLANSENKNLKSQPLRASSCQATADWIAHQPEMEVTWHEFFGQRYSPMKQWSFSELVSRIPSPLVVRYLFGGPDLLSLLAFFPDAPTYILCGMEPIGNMPSIEELSLEELEKGATQICQSTKTFFTYGYFITKEMKERMNQKRSFQGVLPILLTFLALHGASILDIEPFSLGGIPAVKISFQSSFKNIPQDVFYIQADLSNEGDLSIFKWLRSFGPGAAYLKAASYLLHENRFSRAREFLLTESTSILEDDSGIPLRFFNQQQWSRYFFGDYQGPIELFKKYHQTDLTSVYTTSPLSGPMPFGTGYQFKDGTDGGAHLLLFVKKEFIPKATLTK